MKTAKLKRLKKQLDLNKQTNQKINKPLMLFEFWPKDWLAVPVTWDREKGLWNIWNLSFFPKVFLTILPVNSMILQQNKSVFSFSFSSKTTAQYFNFEM